MAKIGVSNILTIAVMPMMHIEQDYDTESNLMRYEDEGRLEYGGRRQYLPDKTNSQ